MPKILDLFCGTKSIAKAFEKAGWQTYTVDWNAKFEPTLQADIGTLTSEDIIKLCDGVPDVMWMSFDCRSFSMAKISYHRKRNPDTGYLEPVSDYAKYCDEVDKHAIELYHQLKPKYVWIENPRGGLRMMPWMQEFHRYTTTYCQWGAANMKPTDIFTNIEGLYFPCCKNGDPCHVPAPRGSISGVQGVMNKAQRSVIPERLCDYIVQICEERMCANAG